MTANVSTSADVITHEEQAAALWTFVHLKIPRFTTEVALEVVKRLAPHAGEPPKALAKRLKAELKAKGINLKHAAALQVAARLLGFENWYAAKSSGAKLTLTTVGPSGGERLAESWQELAPLLCAACDEFVRERPSRLFQVRFDPKSMMVSAAMTDEGKPGHPQSWPILVVNPVGPETGWLDDAPAAMERLRRHLEQPGGAVLDGIAVLQLCEAYKARGIFGMPQAPSPADVCNSELVLLRAGHELDTGHEIARGDEMTCFAQFDLAIKDHASGEVTLDEEYGAWHVGNGRYVWQLSTLRPKEIVPGLMIHELGYDFSERLLRRYKLVKRVFAGRLAYQEHTKRLEYLGALPETWRLDLHKLLHAMNDASLTWESYCAEVGEDMPLKPELPIGFILTLLERLNVDDPNKLFARPMRSQLARVDDDKLLRTLLPRVHHVRYRLASGASAEIQAAVREAIEELSSSMLVQQSQSRGQLIDPKDPLPYLVFAGDGEELRGKLADLGLVMYAGVMPLLRSTKGAVEQSTNMAPFALGYSVYLDIDFAEREHVEDKPLAGSPQDPDSRALPDDYRKLEPAAIKGSGEASYTSPGGQRPHEDEVKGMVEPLRKRRNNGKAYQRRPVVEQELDKLEKLALPDIVARARAGEQKAGPPVSSEALVHILRREVRVARPDGRTQGPIDALTSIVIARCAVILKRRLRGYDELAREQISEEVLNRLVDDIYEDGDKADYAEINFNHWLARNRLDAMRKHARKAARVEQLGEAVENLEDGEAQLVPEDETAEARHDNTPERLYSLKEARERANLPSIIEHAHFSADELHRIADMVLQAKLPADALYAFIAHYLGRKVSSQDPKEHTLVKHFGKSEKTIRNWIARAEKVFAELRKKGTT